MTIPTPSIYKKLLAAKADFDTVLKNKANPFHKSTYADLGAILDAVEPALHKHGLILTQPILDGKLNTCITDIDGGEFINSNIELPEGLEPQKMGSAITYYRRYLLQSLLALHAEDDDAQATVKPQAAPVRPQAQTKPVEKTPHGTGVKEAALAAATTKVYPNHKEVAGDFSTYVPTFGKYKGRQLGTIGIDALAGYVKYLSEDPSKMSASVVTFVEKATAHLKSLNQRSNGYDQTPVIGSDIPF